MQILEAINFLSSAAPCFIIVGADYSKVETLVGMQFENVAIREKERRGGQAGRSQNAPWFRKKLHEEGCEHPAQPAPSCPGGMEEIPWPACRTAQRKLWPGDTIVDFDNSINVSIRILRKTVGDTAEAPRYIETLARRGYRLMVPVEWNVAVTEAGDITKEAVAQVPATESSGVGAQPVLTQPTKEAPPKHWRKSAIAGALALILVVAG